MDHTDIIALIDQISEDTGLKPSSICQGALKNPKLYDNLQRSAERCDGYREKLLSWAKEYGQGKKK